MITIDIFDTENNVILHDVDYTVIEDIARMALTENLSTENIKIRVTLDAASAYIYQKPEKYVVSLRYGRLTNSIPGFSFSDAYCRELANVVLK